MQIITRELPITEAGRDQPGPPLDEGLSLSDRLGGIDIAAAVADLREQFDPYTYSGETTHGRTQAELPPIQVEAQALVHTLFLQGDRAALEAIAADSPDAVGVFSPITQAYPQEAWEILDWDGLKVLAKERLRRLDRPVVAAPTPPEAAEPDFDYEATRKRFSAIAAGIRQAAAARDGATRQTPAESAPAAPYVPAHAGQDPIVDETAARLPYTGTGDESPGVGPRIYGTPSNAEFGYPPAAVGIASPSANASTVEMPKVTADQRAEAAPADEISIDRRHFDIVQAAVRAYREGEMTEEEVTRLLLGNDALLQAASIVVDATAEAPPVVPAGLPRRSPGAALKAKELTDRAALHADRELVISRLAVQGFTSMMNRPDNKSYRRPQ